MNESTQAMQARRSTERMPRRRFLQVSMVGAGALGASGGAERTGAASGRDRGERNVWRAPSRSRYQGVYADERLNRIAFPLGGIGAGMICLEGTGAFSHVSLRQRPEVFHEPCLFAAVAIRGQPAAARVLEGPVPGWKLFGSPGAGNGAAGTPFGLPRFRRATFQARFPFARVVLEDAAVPLEVEITGWSPFEPGDADGSSLPVAAIEYAFRNPKRQACEGVFSFHSKNFLATSGNPQEIRRWPGGFILWSGAAAERPSEEAALAASVDDSGARVNHAWFRGGWWDALTMEWKDVAEAACYDRPPVAEGGPAPGATLFVPFRLEPGEHKTIVLRLGWHVGKTRLRLGKDPAGAPLAAPAESYHQPWYAARFAGVEEVMRYWEGHYADLRRAARRFQSCFHDSTLPPEVMEAVSANLTILKSPTVMRQADGRLWCWEGCSDNAGCCHGSCTHVWNYAQAIPHLFPGLERTLRETEFGPSQADTGHQAFRSSLPIRPVEHDFHAAADGQLGGIMKAHREWRVSGDLEWLRGIWPRIRKSLDYCIETWDPRRTGALEEPHHNTYDIEFWGPNGMCSSFYLGALEAAARMGQALGEDVSSYVALRERGVRRLETELFNGEYFIQKIQWKNLRAGDPTEARSFGGQYSAEARELLSMEGPKYQYGEGCLSDGILGDWLAMACGIEPVVSREKVRQHLLAVHRHNLKRDLSGHANPQRPSYACGAEGGLLLCTWPRGGALSLPFVYSNEVWTGIEYQVASHLMMMGCVEEGLEIVRVCRDRYDGRIRNPFNEYECGHWYARAMSSYALLQGLSGARYDAVEQVLHLEPNLPGDFRCFLSTATGYGTVGVRQGQPFLDVVKGQVPVREIRYRPCPS